MLHYCDDEIKNIKQQQRHFIRNIVILMKTSLIQY